MKLQRKDGDRWNKFKCQCIQLSTGFYAEEYVNATKDIDKYLTYIQTDKQKKAEVDEAAEKSERN